MELGFVESGPQLEAGDVSTWKLRLETQPSQKQLPTQRIHIDICAVPSHSPRPSMLRNIYGINMGTEGLILQIQTREEILADKWIALAFRPNRIKYRDLWDILWLDRQGILLDVPLVLKKLKDRQQIRPHFSDLLFERINTLETDNKQQKEFQKEMERFLPATEVRTSIQTPKFWNHLLPEHPDNKDIFHIDKNQISYCFLLYSRFQEPL